MKAKDYEISPEKFVFVNENEKIHDKELSTKPVGYFKDAMSRFKRNKASIASFFIIVILFLFAILGPAFTQYEVSDSDKYMNFCLPKSQLFSKIGIWDGTKEDMVNELTFTYNYAIGLETGRNVIKNQEYTTTYIDNKGKQEIRYIYDYDTYNKTGVIFKDVSVDEYNAIQAYQDKTGIQVIYPITKYALRPEAANANKDANYWYKTVNKNGGKTYAVLDANGNYQNIYATYDGNDGYTSKMRIEGENTYTYSYARETQTGYEIRVCYYDYYVYYHQEIAKDGIKEPVFLFGSDANGKDVFTCLAHGARLSFILAISISLVNLIVGAIIGAIEGYYGGAIDLIIERLIDILAGTPFMIVVSLLKFHMAGSSQILVLFISFFITGWIGMAGRTRMQFYRFKNQEYVLAARTLGAKDPRIMFKHIFPNAIGTLITGSVLVIPSFIFSESSLSYLGIINLSTGKFTSVGTLLASGQPYLANYPYLIVFPAIFISLLMLSFNLLGNGLRDAFNPSLRGSED